MLGLLLISSAELIPEQGDHSTRHMMPSIITHYGAACYLLTYLFSRFMPYLIPKGLWVVYNRLRQKPY